MEESSKNIIVTLLIAFVAVYAVGSVGSYAYIKNKNSAVLPVVNDAYAMKCKNVIARYQNMVWCRSIEQYHREISETLQTFKTAEALYNYLEAELPIGSSRAKVEEILVERFHTETLEEKASDKEFLSITYSSKGGADSTNQRDILVHFNSKTFELQRLFVKIPDADFSGDWYPHDPED